MCSTPQKCVCVLHLSQSISMYVVVFTHPINKLRPSSEVNSHIPGKDANELIPHEYKTKQHDGGCQPFL